MAKKTQTGSYDIEQLKKYAKEGAIAALAKLKAEIEIIERTFPELGTAKGRSKVMASAEKSARSWSNASRKAVSSRMKKYWAVRKAATAAGGKSTGRVKNAGKTAAKK